MEREIGNENTKRAFSLDCLDSYSDCSYNYRCKLNPFKTHEIVSIVSHFWLRSISFVFSAIEGKKLDN